jgi:hypothetical protein
VDRGFDRRGAAIFLVPGRFMPRKFSPRLQAEAVPSCRSGSTDMIWLQALHM